MENKTFTICVDMDDTIENLLLAWSTWLNNKYDIKKDISEFIDWNMQKAYPNLTLEQIFEPLFLKDFWDNVTPKFDAIKYLDQLVKDGHDVYICTASHYDTISMKYNAIIKKYFPFIDWKHFIVMSNKQLINCDIMIDDGIHNLVGGNYYKILMNAPYNKYCEESTEDAIIRVDDWEEIYQVINLLKTKKN